MAGGQPAARERLVVRNVDSGAQRLDLERAGRCSGLTSAGAGSRRISFQRTTSRLTVRGHEPRRAADQEPDFASRGQRRDRAPQPAQRPAVTGRQGLAAWLRE